jgi:hypothetical protein
MAYKRIVNGMAIVETLCCHIVKTLTRYSSAINLTASTAEKSALAALLAAATVYCNIRLPDPE